MIDRSSTKETDKSALVYARAWLRRSPGPDAWANLAAVYATKYGPDLKRARTRYWRAARRGHRRALFEYGLMLINGEGARSGIGAELSACIAPLRWEMLTRESFFTVGPNSPSEPESL
jgi:TPR repeat protein